MSERRLWDLGLVLKSNSRDIRIDVQIEFSYSAMYRDFLDFLKEEFRYCESLKRSSGEKIYGFLRRYEPLQFGTCERLYTGFLARLYPREDFIDGHWRWRGGVVDSAEDLAFIEDCVKRSKTLDELFDCLLVFYDEVYISPLHRMSFLDFWKRFKKEVVEKVC
jgi:hypothetical protein